MIQIKTCLLFPFIGAYVTRSLVVCVCFVDRLSFSLFSFVHCAVSPSSIYQLWLALWYLLFTNYDYPFGIFYLLIMITLWYLLFTNYDYPFGIFYLLIIITPLVSSNVSHVGTIVNHRCLIIGFIIVIKCATIIYLLILIEIMTYQNFHNRG